LDPQESVPSVLEAAATGETADIYADIRTTLGTSVVNLIWRNLATMPGALRWTWSAVRPLYMGPAPLHAEAVRRTLVLPSMPDFSIDALVAAGLARTALTEIRKILGSYHHTNALALVVLSTLLERYDPSTTGAVQLPETAPAAPEIELPVLPDMSALTPEVQRLIWELNEFGEDTEPTLIASMYRHLAYWTPYLAMIRTLLAPLQENGSLNALTLSTRSLGRTHGALLAHQLVPDPAPKSIEGILSACRQFVEHPIARMTGICAIVRRATPL
jgi:hypothetical protein